ncbi:hypothetical protein [Actinoplanes sp. NPDC049681]|uniref:hypothetical protein n=1 Tax=Actinoplanes sp. NPDC049681 TaxID=3363905 RepID=UPI0037A284CE
MRRKWGLIGAGATALTLVAGFVTYNRGTEHAAPQAAAGAPSRAGGVISVEVAPERPLAVDIPGVGAITGDKGTFSRPGTVEIQPRSADLSATTGVTTAGSGLDVSFHGTALRRPLSLTFDAVPAPSPGAVPVVAHQGEDGAWDFIPARRLGAGRIAVDTSRFSLNVPTWMDPGAWWDGLTAKLASAVGGRTAPLTCSGAPDWFHLDTGHSDLVHICAKTNHTTEGTEVAEVQIKSNRGVSVEVSVPGDPAYVWQEGASWSWRQWTARHLSFDANRTVILPAGATMTVGYPRGSIAEHEFFVSGTTPKAVGDTLVREAVEFLIGKVDVVAVAYTEAKCMTGLSIGPAGVLVEVQDFHEFLTCWTGALAEELSNRVTAAKLVSEMGAGDVDTVVSGAKAAGALGWLVALWPVYQVTFGNIVDKLNELFSEGRSAKVTFRIDPRTAPPAPDEPQRTGGQAEDPPSGGGERHEPPGDSGGQPPPVTTAPAPVRAETVGGTTHTWTNYLNAGGDAGPVISSFTTVDISCRRQGFAVQNGNTWWYRIASPGWDDRYYASADAFYNNGATSGPLLGTPYVDEAVPLC